ncbi:diguanylate cyclase [Melaminivora suipulveris]|uniref:Sensor protein FixL n=2 Tax=Melaminivora suipulveris TaxID=2109913 RepID=A0A2R3Q870_9BURK|nr:diguanylate cyclase [Melaminivora suipulveris]
MLELDHYFLLGPMPAAVLHGTHDPALVLLSGAVAAGSSLLGLHLSFHARQQPASPHRRMALASGAVALGLGIWAMHFIGMLAFRLPARVSYDIPLTLLSLLPALIAALTAMWLLAQTRASRAQLAASGVALGVGIVAMHYSGMAAMRLQPVMLYQPWIFLASVLLAMALSVIALWLGMALPGRGLRQRNATLLAALFMALAICGMHYMGMAAVRFVGEADASALAGTSWREPLALAIAFTTTAVSAIVLALNGLLRYREMFLRVRESEVQLRALVDTAVDAIITIDHQGIVHGYNRSAERIFGWSAQEVCGRNINMLMPQPYRSQHDGHLARYMRTGQAHIIGIGREVTGLRKDGSTIPLHLGVGKAGTRRQPLFIGFLTDLSDLKRAQDQLRISASVFHHSYEAVLILDEQRRIVDLNPAFERATGVDRLRGMHQPVEGFYPGADFSQIWHAVSQDGYWQGELAALAGDGQTLAQRVSIAAVRDGEHAARHFIVVISDITQAKRHERELERLALYDPLTGLPNRRLLLDRLRQGLGRARRHERSLVVCYLDLDGFKQVNDQYGHEAGDALLVSVGQRVQALLRSHDTLARLGGDEMALLLGDVADPLDCLAALERIREAVAQPVELPGGVAQVSASLGYAVYPLDGDEPDLLLRRADQAMYQAKLAGKNQCRRFSPAARAPAEASATPV